MQDLQYICFEIVVSSKFGKEIKVLGNFHGSKVETDFCRLP